MPFMFTSAPSPQIFSIEATCRSSVGPRTIARKTCQAPGFAKTPCIQVKRQHTVHGHEQDADTSINSAEVRAGPSPCWDATRLAMNTSRCICI